MQTKCRSSKLNNFLVLVFLTFLLIVPMTQCGSSKSDLLCILTFCINGLVFAFGIYTAMNKYAISIDLIYWIFMFVFMYFAPMLQYANAQFPWNGQLSDSEILSANIIVLLFNVFYALGKAMARHVRIRRIVTTRHSQFLCQTFTYGKRMRLLFTLLMCLLTAYSVSKTGLLGIVTSRDNAIQAFYSGDNTAVALVVEAIIPAFMAYTVAEAAQGMIKKRENGVRFFLLILCLLICFFPTTLPRYKLAVIYGTILVVLCPWVKKSNNFFWIFALAMFVLFPLLGGARRILELESFKAVFEEGFLGVYLKGDYDAYRMLVSTFRFVDDNGITWGRQLLGVILFFVPRSIWQSKPIGSGATVIQNEFGSSVFSNVSCPIIGEGFINFGLLGVALFGIVIGNLVFKADKLYWENESGDGFSFSPYLFITFIAFFMLRGDLLSGFAYMAGFIITGYILRGLSVRL